MEDAGEICHTLTPSQTDLGQKEGTMQTASYYDGKESIEHQLRIHLLDLTECLAQGDASVFSAQEVLAGIRYTFEYRIRGGRYISLSEEICRQLARCLVCCSERRSGSLLQRGIARDADEAMSLLGNFLLSVQDMAPAIDETFAVGELRNRLRLHDWLCDKRATAQQSRHALTVLHLLSTRTRLLRNSWRELVQPSDWDRVAGMLSQVKEQEEQPPDEEVLLPPQALFFDRDTGRVADMLRTDLKAGLSEAQVKLHREHYGENILPEVKPTSVVLLLWRQVSDFMIVVLLFAIILSLILEERLDEVASYLSPGLLLAVVTFNVLIGFLQEFKSSRALARLSSLDPKRCIVVRNGVSITVDTRALVPGDVVRIDEGDAIPADLRLFEISHSFACVESVLTGESQPVKKETGARRAPSRRLAISECRGNAFMGTMVARGNAFAIVVRVGSYTELGKLNKSLASAVLPPTPLQRKLESLGRKLVVIAIVLCVISGTSSLLHMLHSNNWTWPLFSKVKRVIRRVVGLAVSVIPEGLVAVVSATMSAAMQRLSQQHVLITRISSTETLGSVTVICSDKTGTLTEGRMTATRLWLSTGESIVVSPGGDPESGGVSHGSDASVSFLFHTICSLCNNSAVSKDSSKWQFTGDPTEIALRVLSLRAGFSAVSTWSKICFKVNEFPFDSERKRMSCLYQMMPGASELHLYGFIATKGAPESILSLCTKYVTSQDDPSAPRLASVDGFGTVAVREMSEQICDAVVRENQKMSSEGLRVLALAYRPVALSNCHESVWRSLNEAPDSTAAECDLCFVGLVGLQDPPRSTVAQSVAECKTAGIRICMITGDHPTTAVAIAKAIGIFDPADCSRNRFVTGPELDLMDEYAISSLQPFPCVFARVSPENKLAIVRALQSRKNIVAMTGDGVNDAPAVRSADVGVAMGITGTEITKKAADLILLDDNFSSIVKAVREGRRIFDNIEKFLIYLLACNSAEVLVAMVTLFGYEAPISEIGILLANLIADIPPSMALGFEPPEPGIMTRPPRDPTRGIFVTQTVWLLAIESVAIASLTLISYFLSLSSFFRTSENRLSLARSQSYASISIMQIFLALLSKSSSLGIFQTSFLDNPLLLICCSGSILAIVGSLYIGKVFPLDPDLDERIIPISLSGWVVIVAQCVILFAIVEVAKAIIRRKTDRVQGSC